MRFTRIIAVSTVIAALVGCVPSSSPEELAAQRALGQRVSAEILTKLPAAVTQCIAQVETGSFSDSAFLSAGYRASAVPRTNFIADLSEPVQLGPLINRPYQLAVGIGAISNKFRSGCNIEIPGRSDTTPAVVIGARQAFLQNGFTFQPTGRPGFYTATKQGSTIEMVVERIVGTGGGSYLRIAKG